jgi:hypothetical protein
VLLLKFQQAADGEFSYPKLAAQILNTGEIAVLLVVVQ